MHTPRLAVALVSALGLVAGLAFAGCGPGAYWLTASVAMPPAPYVEVSGSAPSANYVWVDGYWWWDGTQYVWVRGYWATPPVPGYVWMYGGWVQDGGRYVYVHGRWAPPGSSHPVTYVHPQRERVRVQPGTTYRTTPSGRRVVTPMSPRR